MSVRFDAGAVIGGFRIISALSAGGMGAVYIAEQLATRKQRALKVMRAELVSSPSLRDKFLQEAQIGSRIDSEHVVEVIDAGIDAQSGIPWLAMELLRGSTLTDWIARNGPMSAAATRELYGQLCHAMGAAHAANIVHRDLKPDNIFLGDARREGVRFTLKVLDFGIAKLVSEASTKATGAMGTPLFMPPEQMSPGRSITPAADVWAMGLIAFYCLVGRPYWHAGNDEHSNPMMILNEVTSLPIVPPSERLRQLGIDGQLPSGFDGWFARCVARVIEDRFSNAQDLRRGLEAVLDPSDHTAIGRSPLLPSSMPGGGSGTIAAAPADHTMRSAAPAVTDFVAQQRTGSNAALSGTSGRSKAPMYAIAGVAAIALVGALGYGATQLRSTSAASQDTAKGPATESAGGAAASATSSAPVGPEPPKLGLKAITDYENPKPDTIQGLRSRAFWEGAGKDFGEACKRPGAPARWCAAEDFSNGQVALLRNQWKEAQVAFESAIKKDASWASPHIGLSTAKARQDNMSGALESTQTAQRLDPTSWVAVAAGARIHSLNGKYDDAIEEYKRAESLAPTNPLLQGEIALIYHAAAMDTEAARYATKALELDPDLVSVRVLLSERALEKNDGKTALEEADRGVASAPKSLEARAARADALVLLGRGPEAIVEYQKVLDLYKERDEQGPKDPRIVTIETSLARGQLPPRRIKPRIGAAPVAVERSRPQPRAAPAPAMERSRPQPKAAGAADSMPPF